MSAVSSESRVGVVGDDLLSIPFLVLGLPGCLLLRSLVFCSQGTETTALPYIELFSRSHSKTNELCHLLFGGPALTFLVVLKKDAIFKKLLFMDGER